jgi:hypothetical protein
MRIPESIDARKLAVAIPLLLVALPVAFMIWQDDRFWPDRNELKQLEDAGAKIARREDGKAFSADFSIPEFQNHHLKLLRDMPDLSILLLADSQITATGMADVGALSKLTMLDLSGTQPLGAGFANLHRLPRLTKLLLSRRRVSRIELQHVGQVVQL